MAIDGPGPMASLIAALRVELDRKPSQHASRKTDTSTATDGDAKRTPRDAAALRIELAALVRDVSPDDEQALAAIRPRVIRTVLLWEFGAELREHPGWQPMLERITQTLEKNEQHLVDFSKMVRDLQRAFSGGRSPR